MRRSKTILLLLGACAVAAAAFAIGRTSAPSSGGQQAIDQYFAGLRAGEAQGRMEGRALQEGIALPAGDKAAAHDAFQAGYVAGMNDVFAGYDGGWSMHVPWIVTLVPGPGQVVYRIADRTEIKSGIDYYLCPDGHSVCQQRR